MKPIYRWDATIVRVDHEGKKVEQPTTMSILASTAEEMVQKARDTVKGREVEHWTGKKYQTHRVDWTTAVEVEQPPEPDLPGGEEISTTIDLTPEVMAELRRLGILRRSSTRYRRTNRAHD